MSLQKLSVFCFIFLLVSPGVFADDAPIRVSDTGNWLEFRGKKVLLVGDSVTQGWMELGTNFDQNAYVDALAKRRINVLHLWSYIGIGDQVADSRIGYDAPEIWPWVRKQKTFDLTQFNEVYFDRLRALVQYANTKDIVVIITVHDGWTKSRFRGHPFGMERGGPLTDRFQYVELADYNREMKAFDSASDRRQRHQYLLERFCDRLIQATADQPNVMYEIFNEGNWYNQTDLRAFQVHFLNFFKARTARPILVNDDHVGGADFHDDDKVDVISLHRPKWRRNTSAKDFFKHYASKFGRLPAKPYFFTEPVPGYSGDLSMHGALMRLMWGTALGGAGVVVQNDTSFGFDPKAAIAMKAVNRDSILDLEGHLSRFFNNGGVPIAGMVPSGSFASTGVVLARPNHEYIVYSEGDLSVSMDLSSTTGKFIGRFYNPRTGKYEPSFSIGGGVASQLITKPDRADWVLHLVSTPGTIPPAGTSASR